MKTFTVTVAYYDTWNEQTLVVDAHSIDEACTKAIAIADDERVGHYRARSWDPGATFVAGIAEGRDASDNDECDALDNVIGGPIPFEHSEQAAFGTCVLRDALKAALPELESELEQRQHGGKGEPSNRCGRLSHRFAMLSEDRGHDRLSRESRVEFWLRDGARRRPDRGDSITIEAARCDERDTVRADRYSIARLSGSDRHG